MRLILIISMLLTVNGCMTMPSFTQVSGGTRLDQPGLSFIAPASKTWSILVNHSYNTTLATYGNDYNVTLITVASVFNIKEQETKESFLEYIKNERNKEPDIGRYEIINQNIDLYKERTETCVRYSSFSKDFGAKRNGTFTTYETYGMYCIHPHKPNIGVFIELSRKAPIGNISSTFLSSGESLLQSVKFSEFRL